MKRIDRFLTNHRHYSWIISILFALYVFCVVSFNGRSGFNYTIYFVAVLNAGFVLYLMIRLRKIPFTFLLLPFFGFACFAIVPTIFGSHQYRSMATLFLLCGSLWLIYADFYFVGNPKKIIGAFIVSGVLFSAYFLIMYWREILSLNFDRLGDYFDNVNTVGVYFVLFSVICFFPALLKFKRFWWLLIPALLMTFLAYTTGSRKVFIGMLIAIIYLLYCTFRKRKFVFAIIIPAFILVSIGLLQLPFLKTLNSRLISALAGLFGDGADGSSVQRALFLENSVFFGVENMLIGTGTDGFRVFSGLAFYSHNNVGEVLCDFGIFGFASFYLSFIFIVFYGYKKHGVSMDLSRALLLLYLVLGFAMIFYYDKLFIAVLAFSIHVAKLNRLENPSLKIPLTVLRV